MAMKKVLILSAVSEAALGLVLLVYPPIVVRLFLDAEIAGTGIVMGRLAGIALIALGVACWPGSATAQALWGMLTYSALATLYMAYLGIGGEWVGVLLWPATVIHAILTTLLVRAWLNNQRTRGKT
jgi:hypothetical protein